MKSIEERLEDIAAGLGVPLERLKLIVDRIRAKDQMNGDDLLQLTEIGIPFITKFGELVFESPQTVSNMIKEGKVNFFLFTTVIKSITNPGGLFYNLKEKQSKALVNFLRT